MGVGCWVVAGLSEAPPSAWARWRADSESEPPHRSDPRRPQVGALGRTRVSDVRSSVARCWRAGVTWDVAWGKGGVFLFNAYLVTEESCRGTVSRERVRTCAQPRRALPLQGMSAKGEFASPGVCGRASSSYIHSFTRKMQRTSQEFRARSSSTPVSCISVYCKQ